jgi:hypothetical protein
MASGVATYSYDVMAFSVGDAQFNYIESAAARTYFHPPTSDVATDGCL